MELPVLNKSVFNQTLLEREYRTAEQILWQSETTRVSFCVHHPSGEWLLSTRPCLSEQPHSLLLDNLESHLQ